MIKKYKKRTKNEKKRVGEEEGGSGVGRGERWEGGMRRGKKGKRAGGRKGDGGRGEGRLVNRNIFFFNDTATTEIYPLSPPDALPICAGLAPPPHHRTLPCAHAQTS